MLGRSAPGIRRASGPVSVIADVLPKIMIPELQSLTKITEAILTDINDTTGVSTDGEKNKEFTVLYHAKALKDTDGGFHGLSYIEVDGDNLIQVRYLYKEESRLINPNKFHRIVVENEWITSERL